MKLTASGIGLAIALVAAPLLTAVALAERKSPQEPVSNYIMERGVKALKDGDTEKAQDFFEQAVAAYPKNARAFAYLGDAHLKADRAETANKYYETALSINPDDTHSLLRSGEYALTQDDLETAEKNLKRLSWVCERRCDEFRTLQKAVNAKKAEIEKSPKRKADGEDKDDDTSKN